MKFDINPATPTTKTSFGFPISCGSKNLWIASIKIDTHKAIKKIALTRAPKISALFQPYV